MTAFSASKSGLALACGYWLRDDVPQPPPEVMSDAASVGNEFHAGMDEVLTGKRPPATEAESVAALWLSSEMVRRGFTGGTVHIEQAIGFDPYSGKSILLGHGREAYANAPAGWLCGTGDVIVIQGSDLLVVDWKTGRYGAEKALPQLKTLAVLFNGLVPLMNVQLVSAHVDIEEATVTAVVDVSCDVFELEDHAMGLALALAGSAKAQPQLSYGCIEEYCPQRQQCPARAELVASVTDALIPSANLTRRNPLSSPLESDEDVALNIEALAHVENWIKARKGECQRWVAEKHGGEMRVDDTHVYKRVEASRKSVNADQALALAEKMGADPAELAACMRSTTYDMWKRIKKGTAA